MTEFHGWRLAARTWLLVFCLLSGAYALLAYLPFTYVAVIKFPMVNWLPSFLRFHSILFLNTLLANFLVDHQRLRSRALIAFYVIQASLGQVLIVKNPLENIRNDGSSLGLAVVFFLIPTWILLVDLRDALKARPWLPTLADDARRLFVASMLAGLVMTLVFPGMAFLHSRSTLTWEALAMVLDWTLWANFLVFLALGTLLMGLQSLGRIFRRSWVEPALLVLGLWGALTAFGHNVLFRAVAFHGPVALAVSGLLATLGVAYLLGSAANFPQARDECALDFLLRPLVLLLRGKPLRGLVWLLGVVALGWRLLGLAAKFDWNFLFQKTLTLALGALLFAGVYAVLTVRKPRIVWVWGLIFIPMLMLDFFITVDEGMQARRFVRSQAQNLGPALDQEAGRDVEVQFLHNLLSPVQSVGQSIYRLLQQSSNIPREVRTDPVEIQHVELLRPSQGWKPDVFIFVVDSLRRDYLGAYNPAVHFTPELDRFAKESVVMRNGFTRYGATGLSEPSIWTGSVMLHKQYITPFYPMNSLEKLLETDGYQGLVSMDSILQVVVKPGPWLQDLDPGVGTQDLRLGASLGKLETAMGSLGHQPLFVYSQSQDIHVSVLNREGRSIVGPGDYGSFYAPYASRLQRLDQAFGHFLAFLKQQGRFDNSIIIFTADHGDSLGEEGRFGHAYTLFPEIVRIPLLIHLPPTMRQGLTVDASAPSFLVDLTPTLYYLLGHRPVKADPALGRPLFTATAAEQTPYGRDHYLLASSYGAVFGILDGPGRNLYIADGVNFVDYLYRLEDPGSVKTTLTPEQKRGFDRQIVDDIGLVNRFYHFTPAP